jgi:hypothetical protein
MDLRHDLDQSLTQLSRKLGETTAVRCYRAAVEARRQLEGVSPGLGIPCGYSRQQVVYLAGRASEQPVLAEEQRCRDAGRALQSG